MKKLKIGNDFNVEELLQETTFLSKLKHPNIMNLIGVSIDVISDYFYFRLFLFSHIFFVILKQNIKIKTSDIVMILELMPFGSLFDVLHSKKSKIRLDAFDKFFVMEDIIEGLIKYNK